MRRARWRAVGAVVAAALAFGLPAGASAQTATVDGSAGAATGATDGGFSFLIGLARQSVRYRETGSSLPFVSEARADSPLLVSGALYKLDRDTLFSVLSLGTFYPGTATETWRATAPVFDGVRLSDPVLQRNRFSLSESELQVLGLRRIVGAWFGAAGVSARSLSFKRHSFVVGPDHAVNTPAETTVEESSGEVLAHLGLALESEQVRDRGSHYGLRATLGLPLWRRVENTSLPQTQFDGARGADVLVEGRWSRALRPGVHLGLWGQWSVSRRAGQLRANAELPASRLDELAAGLELLWKL